MRRVMKTFRIISVTIIMLISVIYTNDYVYAASTERVHISEYDIDISIPDRFEIYTRDNYKEHVKELEQIGFSEESFLSHMQSFSGYIDALELSDDGYSEITVIVQDNDGFTYSMLSEEEMNKAIADLESELAEMGIKVTNSQTKKYSSDLYICLDFFNNNTNAYGRELLVSRSSERLVITLSQTSQLTDRDFEELDSIINSLTFNKPTDVVNSEDDYSPKREKVKSTLVVLISSVTALIVGLYLSKELKGKISKK